MIIKIDHLSFSSSNFYDDVNDLKKIGYNISHLNESLINLENKKIFLRNYHETQKFCLLVIDDQISVEVLEYHEKYNSDQYMIPHIKISEKLELNFLNDSNFEVHPVKQDNEPGLNPFRIDIHTNNLEKSQKFWGVLGFKIKKKISSDILLGFNSPFSKQDFEIKLILNKKKKSEHFLDEIGLNCIAFISTSIKNDKKILELEDTITSDIMQLKIGEKELEIFFCKNITGEIVEIIQPKNNSKL